MLEELVEMSNRYGSDPAYVLAGGGNTSEKIDTILYVKGSGTSLADITEVDFVSMDRPKLSSMLEKPYPQEDAPGKLPLLQTLWTHACRKTVSAAPVWRHCCTICFHLNTFFMYTRRS